MYRFLFATFLCLYLTSVSQPQELTITPTSGSENPVNVGQPVTLAITGLTDTTKGRAMVWPEAWLVPILAGGGEEETWKSWGSNPQLQFRANGAGNYKVGVLVAEDGPDLWAEYVIEVEGQVPPSVFSVTPNAPFTSSGSIGGPFEPRLQRYIVKATSKWEATTDAEWLVVAPQAGSGATGAVDVIIGAGAEKLKAGIHEEEVTFIAGSAKEVRKVILSIGSEPPPIDLDLSDEAAEWLKAVPADAKNEVVVNPLTKEEMTRQQTVGQTFSQVGQAASKLQSIRATNVMLTTGLVPAFGPKAEQWKPFAVEADKALSLLEKAGVSPSDYGKVLSSIGDALK